MSSAKPPSRGRPASPATPAASPAGSTQTVEDVVAVALRTLGQLVTAQSQVIASHTVTMVGGLELPAAVDAFATYALVVGIGQAIRVNLAIATEMFGSGPSFEAELRRDVDRMIGVSNVITNDFREDQRDPWFTECLGHALLNVSRELPELGPPGGRLEALTLVHTDVRDHGLDLVGLHLEKALLGLSVAEAKASESNASNHGSATAALFAQVDAGTRDAEIRRTVQMLREALSAQNQALVTSAFWRGTRSYLAVISYGASSTFTPGHPRPAYASLGVGARRVRLLAVGLTNYRQFFDDVADQVRALVPVVARLVGAV